MPSRVATVMTGTELTNCCVCAHDLDLVFDLPGLPLTDTFTESPGTSVGSERQDQSLLYCENCGHAQLRYQLDSQVLYGSSYCFRTSTSATARHGTDFFLSVLDSAVPAERNFECVLDVGCNDLYLLRLMEGRSASRVGIDPIWADQSPSESDASIQVIGATLEEIALDSLPRRPDLVFCRHTLEHIGNPKAFLSLLLDMAADDAIFVFELPMFDPLLTRFRFDQVFHQHLQYFTVHSFETLVAGFGCSLLASAGNYHDWGAMAFAFTKSTASRPVTHRGSQPPGMSRIQQQFAAFQLQIGATRCVLESLKGEVMYGYGAAQMLPVLGYHLQSDFSNFRAILDDDPAKDGKGYSNLPVPIKQPSAAVDLGSASVLITAVDNVGSIMPKLMSSRPRHVIHPFTCI